MLEIIGTIFSSVLSGGATGLLGILIQRYFDGKAKAQEIDIIKLNLANAVDLKRIDLQLADKEWSGKREIAIEDRNARQYEALAHERAAEDEATANMFAASHESDRAKYLTPGAQKANKWAAFMMAFVDFARGIIRPGLTVYLVALTHVMFLWVRDLANRQGMALTMAETKEIIMLVIGTILYLATVSVVWWFGTRPVKRAGDK